MNLPKAAPPSPKHRELSALALVLGLATAVAVTLTSCGQQMDGGTAHVTVGPAKPVAPTGLELCRQQISRHMVRVDGAKAPPTGEISASTRICQVNDADTSRNQGADGAAAKVFKYEPTDVPLRYSVSTQNLNQDAEHDASSDSKNASGLEIHLKIAIDVPDSQSMEFADATISAIKKICVAKIYNAWDQKTLRVALKLDIESTRLGTFDESSDDQTLVLADAGLSDPSLVMYNWPDRGVFYPNGRKGDLDKCTSLAEKSKCRAIALATANQSFCRGFARVVGQWLGLDGAETRNGKCVDPATQKASSKVTADNASTIDKGGFMKTDATDASEFWKSAKFKYSDVKTILGPVCKGADFNHPGTSIQP